MAQEDHDAAEVYEAEEVLGLVLPAQGQSAPTLQPREEPLDLPSALVTTQRSPVLLAVALGPALALGSDELDAALFLKPTAQGTAIPCLVPDQPRREFVDESNVESSLGEHTVESGSAFNKDSEWKTIAVCHCHELGRLAGAAFPDAGPPFFAGM